MDDSSRKLIYTAVKERYDFEIERIKHLDDKANNTMTVAGILAALVSGFASLSTKVAPNFIDAATLVAFVLCLCLLLESFYMGLKAQQIRSYTIVPDPPLLIGEGEKMDEGKIVRILYDACALATDTNMKKNEDKVGYIKTATWLLLASLVSFSIFAFLTIARGS